MNHHEYTPVAADTSLTEIHSESVSLSPLENEIDEAKSHTPSPLSTPYSETIHLLKSSLPLNLTHLLHYTHNLTTLYIISHSNSASSTSHKHITALSLSIAISNITGHALFSGLLSCLDTLLSQAKGARKNHLIGLNAQKFLCFAGVVYVFVVVLWLCSGSILRVFMGDKEVAGLCGGYLGVLVVGIPGFVGVEVGKRVVLVQGEVWGVLWVMLVTTPVHFGLSWVFVRCFGWGLQGAALATVVTNTLNPALLLLYVHLLSRKCLACWPGFTRIAFKDWALMIRLSIAGMAIVESEWIAFDILAVCASYISANSLAAYSIASSTMSILYQVPLSTAICASLRIGKLVGLGRVDILPEVIKIHLAIGAIFGMINGVLILSLASVIPRFFTSNLEVQHIASNAFVVVGLVAILDATTAMANGILRGIGRQRVGCWFSLLGYYLLTIPASLLLTFGPAKLWTLGLWIGLACGLLSIAAVEILYIWRADWRKVVFESENRNETW